MRPGGILKPDLSGRYARVALPRVGGGFRRPGVHQLVALAFLGEPPADRPYVDHINENKRDNRVDNLRYVSPAENRSNQSFVVASSGRRGIHKSGTGNKPWMVRIGRAYYGNYLTLEEAEDALAKALGA
jgi:hypothetical protein